MPARPDVTTVVRPRQTGRDGGSPAWIDRLDELHLLTPLRIVVIVLVAVGLTIVLSRLAQRIARRTVVLAGRFDPGERIRTEARQQALASSLRSALVGVIWAVAVITVVGELGVNVGGVVATATVIGGAIAFGAQTLIRDVIAGFFVLAEDQYGVGDQVDLGHATGTVERITLRSARVRDAEGRVWYVPHGNVVRVANLSKSPLAALDLEVERSTPVPVLAAVALELGAALEAHEAVSSVLDGAPRVVGLTDVRDDRLVYRIVVATQPGRHDEVRRAWRELALARFHDGTLRPPTPPAAPAATAQS